MTKEIISIIYEYCNRCMYEGNKCNEENCPLYLIEQIIIERNE